MKRISLLIFGLYVSFVAIAQDSQTQNNTGNSFILEGKIKNSQVPYIYLKYTNYNDINISDSSKIEDGKFRFEGKIGEPTWAILKANSKVLPDENNFNICQIYLEKGLMSALVSYNEFSLMKLSGSTTQDDKVRYDSIIGPHTKRYAAVRKSLEVSKKLKYTKIQLDSLSILEQQAVQGMRSAAYEFISTNPNSYISVHELRFYTNRWSIDTVRHLFYRLTPELKKSKDGQEISKKLIALDSAAVGTAAFNFQGAELSGKTIRLSDFKGKFVLIDFWGSWCAPCREGNPHLIKLYHDYKDRNLEIIGISCFDKVSPWKGAIKKDGLGIWKNIMDINESRGDSTIAHKYAVYSFPTKILIDKSGKIIGRYNGSDSDALDKMLEQTIR